MIALTFAQPRKSSYKAILWMILAMAVFLPVRYACAAPHMGFVHQAISADTEADDLFAEAARLHLQSRGVETVMANATLDTAEQQITTLAAQGVEILVITSPRLFDIACKLAPAYPKTLFCVRTDTTPPEGMTGYQSRTYEAAYLAGVWVASQLEGTEGAPLELRLRASDSEKTPPDAETFRNRNAFALGVRSVLPTAHIVLTPTEGIKLVEAMQQVVQIDWRNAFASMLTQLRFGIWQGTGRTLWYGKNSGVIRPEKGQFASGALQKLETLFSGPLSDNTGQLRIPKGQRLNDAELAALDWYVDGIRE